MPAERTVEANTLATTMNAIMMIAVSIPVIPWDSVRNRDNIGSIPGNSYPIETSSYRFPTKESMGV
jgi:hypothetical protein